MSTYVKHALNVTAETRPHAYRGLTELIEILATGRDSGPLEEFLWHRTVFTNGNDKRRHLLTDHLKALLEMHSSHRNWSLSTTIWEEAHDLTLDKFTQLPDDCPRKKKKRQTSRPRDSSLISLGPEGTADEPLHRVDRRKYYAALLNEIKKEEKVTNATNEFEREAAATFVTERFIKYQFYLSLKEAKRRLLNPFISRYTWRFGEKGSITVIMPKYIEGRKRGMWLQENVKHADPSRPGERDRIQAIINAKLAIPNFANTDDVTISRAKCDRPNPRILAARTAYPNLVEYIANEKATRMETLRPAVRKRGEEGVKALVRAVMENVLSGEKCDCTLARETGLSKATFSRFAGRQWSEQVPDLWRNVATEISRDPVLHEAAQEAGVYKSAANIVGAAKQKDEEAKNEC